MLSIRRYKPPKNLVDCTCSIGFPSIINCPCKSGSLLLHARKAMKHDFFTLSDKRFTLNQSASLDSSPFIVSTRSVKESLLQKALVLSANIIKLRTVETLGR